MIDGSGSFGIRRCKSLEENNTLDCLIKTSQEITENADVQATFNEVEAEMEKSYNTYEIRIKYNLKNCPKKQIDETLVSYTCVFQLVALVNQDEGDMMNFGLTLYQRGFSALLKEGQIIKDTVTKENYHYYAFMLPETANIEEVAFFYNAIQGDILCLLSDKIRFPTLFETDDSITIGS